MYEALLANTTRKQDWSGHSPHTVLRGRSVMMMKQLMIHTLLSEVVKGTLTHTPRKTGCNWTVALTHISTVSQLHLDVPAALLFPV